MKDGHKRFIFILLTVVITMGLSSCSTMSERAKSFNKTIRGYEKAIRWGKFDLAQGFRKGPQQHISETERRRLQNIRITGYEAVNTSVSEDHSTATQLIRIRYYHDEYAVERTIMDQQTWVFDEDSSRWHLDSAVPRFR